MRHIVLTGIFLITSLLCHSGLLGAIEVELSGGVNFLTFHHDKSRAYSTLKEFDDLPDEFKSTSLEPYEPFPFIFGNLSIKDDIAENIAFNINFTRDSILRDSIETLFIANTDYFSFQFGPFLGIPNVLGIDPKAPEIPFFGILSNFQLLYPGVVFLELSGSTTLGHELPETSNHVRHTLGTRLGFWLPSAIPSISANYKSFKKVDSHLTIQDTLTRFQFSIDFYSKEYPVTFRMDAGYQILTRKYDNNITKALTDEVNICFAGFELKLQASNIVKIILGAELPIVIITDSMVVPDFYKMPKASLGFVFSSE